MKKQGFTLIELMVVIVIMGILAAVAVPKLFGMIAKSKASEVPTAAGTWINMQDAYFQEKQTVGDWGSIGYSGPGAKSTTSKYKSDAFTYTETSTTSFDWIASPNTKLDDCPSTGFWKLQASNVMSNGDAVDVKIADAQTTSTCKLLTASWDKLMKN
jgi:prepilin-type N-terminal cleavage/methylation domain